MQVEIEYLGAKENKKQKKAEKQNSKLNYATDYILKQYVFCFKGDKLENNIFPHLLWNVDIISRLIIHL